MVIKINKLRIYFLRLHITLSLKLSIISLHLKYKKHETLGEIFELMAIKIGLLLSLFDFKILSRLEK
jgi:hypothetical protein